MHNAVRYSQKRISFVLDDNQFLGVSRYTLTRYIIVKQARRVVT